MWKRREILGALATGAAGVALAANRTDTAAGPGEDVRHRSRHENVPRCVPAL